MNRFLCGSLLLAFLSGAGSCSLLKPGSGNKHNSQIGSVTDTSKIAQQGRPHFVALPEQDTISMLPDTTGLMRHMVDMVLPVFNKRNVYTTFSAKAKVHFESPEDKQDFTANIRVKKDSAIWIDITALGGMFHAARAYVTTDSFFMINYQQKEVTKLPLKQVAKVLPTQVDFMSLQNLIIGEPLRNGAVTNVSDLASSWLLAVEDSNYVQRINYRKSDSVMVLLQMNTRDPKGPEAVLKFDNFENNGSKKIAVSRAINILNGTDRFLLEMELQNMEFDKQLEMPFSIPAKYTIKSNQ